MNCTMTLSLDKGVKRSGCSSELDKEKLFCPSTSSFEKILRNLKEEESDLVPTGRIWALKFFKIVNHVDLSFIRSWPAMTGSEPIVQAWWHDCSTDTSSDNNQICRRHCCKLSSS